MANIHGNHEHSVIPMSGLQMILLITCNSIIFPVLDHIVNNHSLAARRPVQADEMSHVTFSI